MPELETREQAWAQLHDALHTQLNQPRKDWPVDVQERQAEAQQFLDDNPPPAEDAPEPVTIVLSKPSLKQIEDVILEHVGPMQDSVRKLSGCVDLITRIADGWEFWLGVLDPDTIVTRDGEKIELTEAQVAYVRTIVGEALLYAGRPDYLTQQLGEAPEARPTLDDGYSRAPVNIPPMPATPTESPQVVVVAEPGVSVSVSAPTEDIAVLEPPQQSQSLLAQTRAARQAIPTDMPSPNVPQDQPGNPTFEGADPHNCREFLDVDDICGQCGAHVPPVRVTVVD